MLSDDMEGCIGIAMQHFEYTRFCLERGELKKRDILEWKRKSRADEELPETSANNLVPRVLSLEVERGPWERG